LKLWKEKNKLIEVLSVAIYVTLFGGIVLISRKLNTLKQPAVTATAPAKAISASQTSSHRLVKTYIARGANSDHWIDGWRFLCSCGAKGASTGLKAATYSEFGSMGTESGAVGKFKTHRDLYLEVNGSGDTEHEDTVKLKKLEAEFAEWRNACFCKDTNDDLILLKHRHLDSVPVTKVE